MYSAACGANSRSPVTTSCRTLEEELTGYARELGVSPEAAREAPGVVALPLRLRTEGGELAFVSMIATFGTALDITLAELSIETFLPADAATSAVLGRLRGP